MKTDDAAIQGPAGEAPSTPATAPSRARKKSQQALDDYLSALFPMPAEGSSEASAGAGTGAQGRAADQDAAWIERSLIEPNPAQPRRTWSEASLRELGLSLARDGQLQACVVRPHPSRPGFYQLVSGERRWRASAPEFANIESLRCTVREVGDEESLRLALVENLQREDLNDIDKARAFVELRDSLRASDPRVTWSQVGQAVGLSREYLHRLRALLELPSDVQDMVRSGTLSGRSARALTGLRDAQAQTQLAQEIQSGTLSSDQALARARALSASQAGCAGGSEPAATRVTRGSHGNKESRLASREWEEALRQAVSLLVQARQQEPATGRRSQRAQKLIEQAHAHIQALHDGQPSS